MMTGNVLKIEFLKIILMIINLFFASPVFKLVKNRIYSKAKRLNRRRKPPSSQPSLQQK
jgi:hypothetical protein